MYLKEIQVENFKSFKGKMNVPFMPGYTGITGPNGCGKSNISDAVLFVLGPRSSRAIRAGRLTDLIFNGGKGGKPAAYCKVSLVFDNSDRILPIKNDEVKLTRLVKRSKSQKEGYLSYFYVNENKSKMSDFENILSHARVSADGYNLVQQGDITRIVEMGPVERRTILDDIAGITRFDQDIDKAEKEKDSVDDNMERIDIIMAEIKKQIGQLENERGSAMKYRELKEKLDMARTQMELKKKESIENEIAALEEQISKRDMEIDDSRKKKELLKKELVGVERSLRKFEDEIANKSTAEGKELKEKIDSLRVEIARARDSVEGSKEEISMFREEKKEKAADLRRLEREMAELEAKREDRKKKLAVVKKKLESSSKELKSLELKISKADNSASVQKELVKLRKDQDAVIKEIQDQTLERDRVEDKIHRLDEEITDLEERRHTLDFEIKDAEFKLKDMRKESRSSEREIKDAQDAFINKKKMEEKMARQALDLEAAIKSLTREYNHLKAESDAAKSVKRGYTAAVNQIMEARDRGQLKGIHGTVAELAKVDRKYETAIATAAGPRMQAVIVDDDAVAEECISYLKKYKIGRATFLPMNKMLDARPRGKAALAVKDSEGFAIDLVDFDERYRSAFWYVFGDTIVVDGIGKARELMGGVRIVTTEGELIEASGAMIGGIKEKKMITLGGGEKGDLEAVTKKLRKATDEADKLGAELSSVRLELIELEKRVKELGAGSGSSLGLQGSLEVKKKELKTSLKKIDDEIEAKRKEMDAASTTLDELDVRLAKAEKKASALKEQREDREKQMMKLTPIALTNELRKLQTENSSHDRERAELDAEISGIDTQLKIFDARRKELESQIADYGKRVKAHEDNIKSKSKDVTKLDTELKAMLKVEESMGKELVDIRNKRDEAYKTKTGLEAEIEKINHAVEAKGDFLRGLKIELESAQSRLREIEEAVKAIKLDQSKKIPSMETLKKTIRSCEVGIEALGSVNMLALDTYDEQKDRYAELKEEVKKLKDQRKKLMGLVKELKLKKKTGLLKVYKGINEKFKDVYAELSDGGEAELVLEDEDDPFQGGLLIKARPKGKKVHRMEALSGGEKGLVSMSFIFAIQRYQPSPFYMLDEVDQNLDAINAKNIAQMIKRNSGHAQFLQISLREVTLKEADNLIGVTMQKEGISDLVMKVDLGNMKFEDSKSNEKEVKS